MKKLAIVHGAISGSVIIAISILAIELGVASVWLGYLVMLIAFSAIFIAVKQYRDGTLGGVIRFQTGFLLGLGITLTASAVYVLTWEAYLAATDYAFIDVYTDSVIKARQAAGVTDAELATVIADMETVRRQYHNPAFRLPMTFVEIFPVGLLVSLATAFGLRTGKRPAAA